MNFRREFINFVFCTFFLLIPVFSFSESAEIKPYQISEEDEKSKKFASLQVRTNVSDADVVLNGVYYGKSPLTVKNLVPGTYRISVSKKGYKPKSQLVTLRAGTERSYYFTLEEITGFIKLNNLLENSEIYVDGLKNSFYSSYWGENNLAKVRVGYHSVRVRKFGYEDFYLNVSVYEDRITYADVNMKQASFGLSDFKISREKFNPLYDSNLGKVEFSFSVTSVSPDDAFLYIYDVFGVEKLRYKFEKFTTWNQNLEWDGKIGNLVLQDGIYKAVIKAGNYEESLNFEIDSSLIYPIFSFTNSGSGIGSIPVIQSGFEGCLVPFILTDFKFSLNDSENSKMNSWKFKSGILFNVGSVSEFMIGLGGFTYPEIKTESYIFNVSGKFGKRWETSSGNENGFSALIRYGYSAYSEYQNRGIDSGIGLGYGIVYGIDFKKSYLGLSSEVIHGILTGNLSEKANVWKTGLSFSYKPNFFLSLNSYAALHSSFGKKIDGENNVPFRFFSAAEAGFEINAMPFNFCTLSVHAGVNSLIYYTKEIYLGANIGLSYLF